MTLAELGELSGKHFVAGERRRAAEPSFSGRDPRTGKELPPGFAEATREEIAEALEGARAALRPLRDADDRRADLLERIALNIEALGDELLDRASLETALPKPRLESERARTLGQLRLFSALALGGQYRESVRLAGDPERQPAPRPELFRVLRPLGPVVVFGASNFPFAYSVAGGDTASALAVGCPVVVKAHPNHPGTSELVAACIERAVREVALPAGTFSLLHGQTPETGLGLVRHPHTRAVGFTGSHAGGRALFDAAAARADPIPVFAEMGSVNPVFLLPRALEERGIEIADGLHASFTLGVGQFCTSPGLVFLVAGAPADAFLEAFAQRVRATAPGTLLHAGIKRGFAAGSSALEAHEGVTVLGRGQGADGPCGAQSLAFRTSYRVFAKSRRLREEVFGPSTLIVVCESPEELFEAAEALEGQLTASVHTSSKDARALAALLPILEEKAGRLILNGYPTGVEVSAAMQHGGPYPASTDARFTAVGETAARRFLRPVCFQGFPDALLPTRAH